jgi:hypothetical protein
MRARWIAIVGLGLVIACKSDKSDRSSSEKTGTGAGTGSAAAPLTGFNPLTTPDAGDTTTATTTTPGKQAPGPALTLTELGEPEASALGFKGSRLDLAHSFQDARGYNAVIVSSTHSESHGDEPTTTRRLWIEHVRHDTAGKPVVVREMKDIVEKCWGDATLVVVDGPTVTDLDGDSIGEITVVYRIGCRSDVSPIGLKVLMIEDGTKYAVRGETRIEIEGTTMGGTRSLDPAAPPGAFRAHLLERFDANVDEQLGTP